MRVSERERERLYYKLKQASRIAGRPLAKQIIIYGFYLLDRPTTKMDCIKVTNVKLSYYDYTTTGTRIANLPLH